MYSFLTHAYNRSRDVLHHYKLIYDSEPPEESRVVMT